jgi:hypothetical protein
MIPVAADLFNRDFARFQECLDVICVAVDDSDDGKTLCDYLHQHPELHHILVVLPLPDNPFRSRLG